MSKLSYAGLLIYKDVIAFIKWKTDINNSDIGHYVASIYLYDEIKEVHLFVYDKANYDIAESRTLNYILDYYLDK